MSVGTGVRPRPLQGIGAIVGFLVCVEVASGAIQGYYTPLYTDIAHHLGIADADVNWFEAAQLALSALVVAVLARVADLVGHRQVLLASTAVTALATWGVALAPNFWTFLVSWAFAGCYAIWLPLEIAIIHRRTQGEERKTRLAAAVLVCTLEVAVIATALTSGALADVINLHLTLSVPAVIVTLALPAVWWGVPGVPVEGGGRLDVGGVVLITAGLGILMTGLILVRVLGPGNLWALLTLAAAVAVLVVFVRFERTQPEPLLDTRLLSGRGQAPIQLASFFFGFSVLGAQIPLSTFARTDPSVTGYGLGASAARVSTLIGLYVATLAVGAVLLPFVSRRLPPRGALAAGSLLVAAGYLLFLPRHGNVGALMLNLAIAGVGSGMLVAGLPAAAAAAAPSRHTGLVTGMTNMTKTVGGAIASSLFAIALATTGSIDSDAAKNHAPLNGYLTVWAICGVTAFLGGALLLVARPATSGETEPHG